jgi:preprotein translocase subunit SecB
MGTNKSEQVSLKTHKAPIKLKNLFFPEIHYRAIPHEDPGEAKAPALKIVKAIPRCNDDGTECTVSLKIKSEETSGKTKLLFEYEIFVLGVFEWTAKTPDDKEQLLKSLAVTGASILYSSAREMLAFVSGRGPWGSCILPTVSFIPEIETDAADTTEEETEHSEGTN